MGGRNVGLNRGFMRELVLF